MAAYGEIGLAFDTARRRLEADGAGVEGDTVRLRVAGAAASGADVSGWRAYLYAPGGTQAVMAAASGAFEAQEDGTATAELPLDTAGVRSRFDGSQRFQRPVRFWLQLWDEGERYEVGRCELEVMYNPLLDADRSGLAPLGVYEAGQALEAWAAVRFGGDGKLRLFDPYDPSQEDLAAGLASAAAEAGDETTLVQFGAVTRDGWDWTPGKAVWVGAGGALTQAKPTDAVQAVLAGVAFAPDGLLVRMGTGGPRGYAGLRGFPGADGTNGRDGTDGGPGVNGTPGADGAQMLSGATVPAEGDGRDGDIWLDTGTWTLYRKAGGAWAVAGSIAPQTEAIGLWVLEQVAAALANVSLGENPSFDEVSEALAATVNALKQGG